jgi:hypothetical protein
LRPRRRPWLLVGGLLAMVISALVFSLISLRSDDRAQVLAVAQPVAAGKVLAATDLRVVQIVPDPGLDYLPASGAAQVIGRTAAVPLRPGALLSGSQLGPSSWPPDGQAVVAVPVKPGRLPAGIAPGARVLIIPVASDAAAAPSSAPGSGSGSAAAPVAALVVAVAAGGGEGGASTVTLLVPREQAVSVAGSSGDLALAMARR